MDLPYIQKVMQCLKSDGQNVTWHWNRYDHGEKNDQYEKRVMDAEFHGKFVEYEC